MKETRPADDLGAEVASVPWYHSIPLPGGVLTPGEYDLTGSLGVLPLPASLAGRRCVDVGTHDGFWAFEMERRGASGVMAIDLDDPDRLDWPQPASPLTDETRAALAARRRAFEIARRALGSSVERRNLSVYDLDPELVGEFDFAFLGTLLHHLRDPVGALAAVRRVVRGELLVNAVFSISKTLLHPRRPVLELFAAGGPFWEVPNMAALRRQVRAAGWEIQRAGRPYLQRHGAGWSRQPLSLQPGAWSTLPRDLMLRRGAPHVWLLATPA